MNSDTNKQNIKKIKLLDKYLQNSISLYSGLAIKKYITKSYFEPLDLQLSNPISAGRYSVYAHNQIVPSFKNLVEKHKISAHSNTLVHPLLDLDLVSILDRTGTSLVTLDIDKSTLNWSTAFLKLALTKASISGKPLDQVIMVCHSGLTEEILEQLKLFGDSNIQVLLIFAFENLSITNFECFKELKLGSILFYSGEDFLAKHLLDLNSKDTSFFPRKLILSLFIESRASSILEYQMKDEQNIYTLLLESYFLLLKKKTNAIDFTAGFQTFLDNVLSKDIKDFRNIVSRKNIDFEQVRKQLVTSYMKSQTKAVPDCVFELENNFPTHRIKTKADYSNEQIIRSDQAKKWHTDISQIMASLENGKVEIPIFYKQKVYSRYFFYTTDFSYFQKLFLEKKLKGGIEIHPKLLSLAPLPIASFVGKYIVLIDL
jgi:hypothetical protein